MLNPSSTVKCKRSARDSYPSAASGGIPLKPDRVQGTRSSEHEK
jgi:hypothetical protein